MTLFDASLRLLRSLIRNACVNDLTPDSGQEHTNAATLEEFFAGSGAVVRRFEPHPGRVSVAFTVPGTDPHAEPLTLLGHTDVVPVDRDLWTRDPFAADIEDGRLYGRGATDMLYITAAMAAVTRDVARRAAAGDPPRGTLTFVALADEEARGGLGAGWIAEHEPEAFSWRNTLSEEGGSHLIPRDRGDALVVVVGEKGAAQRRLHVVGDVGHGSAPYDREQAVVKIAEVARRVATIRPAVPNTELWQGFVRAFAFDPDTERALLSQPSVEDYRAFGDLAGYADAMSHTTFAQTVLRAGQAINVLPGHAYLEMDIRPLPGVSDEDVDKLITDALGDLAGEVRIERLISEEATLSPTSGPLYEAIVETFGHFFPDAQVVPTIAAGGSDLRFARRKGGVGYGFALHAAGRTLGEVMRQLHNHDEYVTLEDVRLTTAAYEYLVRRFVR